MHCPACGNMLPGNCDCESRGSIQPVGSCLKKIIPTVFSSGNCKCNETASWMDRLGIEGCIENRAVIIDRIVAHSSRRKILAVVPEHLRRTVAETWFDKAIVDARKVERDWHDQMQ